MSLKNVRKLNGKLCTATWVVRPRDNVSQKAGCALFLCISA
ncbi:hypothetical protein T08_25 [Trichinella sp. T8]|nr:hypothetical protein T08_25 [Trichinella sp. T8]